MPLSARHSPLFTFLKASLVGLLMAPTIGFSVPMSDLPATLAPADSIGTTPTTNTPEYVVIRPSEQVTFSSETAASVAELNVHEGSRFKAGDILLKLDCRLQQAELDEAKAHAESTGMADQSAKKLKSYGSISELELVKAHSEALVATAEVEKLEATVDKCVIKAPFNGAVAELFVHPLETVKTGDPLLKIVNIENLEFEIQIPSPWLEWLKIGSTFYVHINETDQNVEVKVLRIDPEIESVSQTIKIIGGVAHPDNSLLPGMSGQASFPDNPDKKNKIAGK
jgi:RND family efflux transporter MFP subunit